MATFLRNRRTFIVAIAFTILTVTQFFVCQCAECNYESTMRFHGLFVGIDRYASPLISDLTCAARDATALYALFCDTLGAGDSILLSDGSATREGLINALRTLSTVKDDDTVVISFSGHGSDCHHIVTYDTDPMTLDATALHLDELTSLFSNIPAKNVVLFLDCCFSGGAGARVFHAPYAARDLASADAILHRLSGKGRVIFTASTAIEEAIEDRTRGHGLFTFCLLEGLRGAPEVLRKSQVSFLQLVDFVIRAVDNRASIFRHQQHPTLRGSIDGELTIPVLIPGALYEAHFPGHTRAEVDSSVASLAAFGFPPELLHVWQKEIPSLNILQQRAINETRILDGEHVVVSAPTSSGKTMIGELAAARAFLNGERTYFLLPLRALVNDKYDETQRRYGGYGLRVIRSTGEIADDNDALLRGKFDIALLTYERFAALALTAPHILRQAGLVIVDEVQMITDIHRGANLEFLLTLLRAQRAIGVEPQLIALSAVIGDVNAFDSWLGARLLQSTDRPVPLEEGTIDMSGKFHYLSDSGNEEVTAQYIRPEYRKGSSQDIIIPLVRKLVGDGEKVIVFRETKPIVRATAKYLSETLDLPPLDSLIRSLPGGDPSAASELLRQCLAGGVAFHNADLDREERQVLEQAFRDPQSDLRILVTTTTLAMGVNTPASSVVIAGLEHPGNPYSVAEYKNMVGRAGRLGFTERGKSFLVTPSSGDEYRLWHTYVLGSPEPLVSRFADQDTLSLVCRVLASSAAAKVGGMTEADLVDFIQSTFAAHQRGAIVTGDEIISALHTLESGKLVQQIDRTYILTELGKVAGELGIHVESVIRVARALRGVSGGATKAVLLAAAQVSAELDEVIFPIHKTSIKERQRWRSAVQDLDLPSSVLGELRRTDEAGYTSRCKRLSAVLMWIDGVELNRMETSLLRHLPGDNAAGPIRATAERTRDLIGVVGRVAYLVATDLGDVGESVDSLSIQLELGIPPDMVWLGNAAKRALERGDYLALRQAGYHEADLLRAAREEDLKKILVDERKVLAVRQAVADLTEESMSDAELPMPRQPR